MKRYKLVLGFIIVILLIFSLYGFAVNRNTKRTIKNVTISFVNLNEPIISEKNVNKLLILNKQEFYSTPLEKVALNAIETKLRNHPMVRNADISLTIDGKLEAIVEPRKPIARIMGVPNQYLDADNRLMPLSSEYTVLVPLIYGYKKTHGDSIFKLAQMIREDALLKDTVTSMWLDNRGDAIMSVRGYDYKILFGAMQDFMHKWMNYKAFLAKMLKENNLQQIKTIDLRFKGQVVVVKKERV